MKNLIIFLSTFTATILLVIFMSAPAVASGAGGSWGDGGTPTIYPPNPDCPTSTNPYTGGCGGGSSGGGGSGGGEWDGKYYVTNGICSTIATSKAATCKIAQSLYGYTNFGLYDESGDNLVCTPLENGVPVPPTFRFPVREPPARCLTDDLPPPPEPPPPPPPPPDFPDLPPPTPDCNVCSQLYQINMKLNTLKNYDIKIINQSINDMSQSINNIDNSITSLNLEMNTVNNNLTMIDNSIGDMITNIENNNITQNEIKNEINNIKNIMNDYSLKLGDIDIALGDIDLSLKNTNRLVLDLGLDLDFIKNKLAVDTSKDYTAKLNEIIDLLKPCVPTEDIPCPVVGDDEVLKKLKEIQDFMQADFVSGDEDTEVEVTDLTDIELDRNLIKFGVAQCPPDNEFSTVVNGFSFSGGFKHKPLCDFFDMLAPFVKAFGGFSAALILGGGLRRG